MLEDEIKKKELELDELKRQLKLQKTTVYSLAEELHSHTCRVNHTDGCGWTYEDGPNKWNHSCHFRYYEKVMNFMTINGLSEADVHNGTDNFIRLAKIFSSAIKVIAS